jgi:hypothetical protein
MAGATAGVSPAQQQTIDSGMQAQEKSQLEELHALNTKAANQQVGNLMDEVVNEPAGQVADGYLKGKAAPLWKN